MAKKTKETKEKKLDKSDNANVQEVKQAPEIEKVAEEDTTITNEKREDKGARLASAFETTLDRTLKTFIGVTAKSRVAVIVPLFGYRKDIEGNQLGVETLKATLDRIYSGVHQTYILFVGSPDRMSPEVQNYIYVKSQAGNARGIKVDTNASYSEHIKEGLDAAINDTDANYFVIVSPWTIVQHGGLDVIIDRINRSDNAKIVSGYDLRGIISDSEFDEKTFQIPREERDLNFNFVAVTRSFGEMLEIDTRIRTHQYLARDIWQTMYSKGYDVITTQRVPIFSFDIDWLQYEPSGEFEADKLYFISKWGFSPEITV